MRTALADAGASLEDVLSTRVLVASTRQEDLVAAWEVVRDSFGDHDVPSTLMGATVLGYKDQLVEIEVVAATPPVMCRGPGGRGSRVRCGRAGDPGERAGGRAGGAGTDRPRVRRRGARSRAPVRG
jgi:hypothetical protein